MANLGVNVDHIATVRQARYRHAAPSAFVEPDPVALALMAMKAGAVGITVHLREDRRHIQEPDVWALRKKLPRALNLEMAVTATMQAFALRLAPSEACLVPENRQEVTTEGGLDLLGQEGRIRSCTTALRQANILVSLFIDPDADQIRAAADVGAPFVELHTGVYANAGTKKARLTELKRHAAAATFGESLGIQINAGHGLNYLNVQDYVRAVPSVQVLNIGHAIVSRALVDGWSRAVSEMVELCSVAKS
jgi:pyridoxine 5-phosphate synthase